MEGLLHDVNKQTSGSCGMPHHHPSFDISATPHLSGPHETFAIHYATPRSASWAPGLPASSWKTNSAEPLLSLPDLDLPG
jgi:hypothetical protein